MSKLSNQLLIKVSPELDSLIDQAYVKHISKTNKHITKSEFVRTVLNSHCSFSMSSDEALIIYSYLEAAANKAKQNGHNDGATSLQEMAEKFRDIWESINNPHYSIDLEYPICTNVKFINFTSTFIGKTGSYQWCRDTRIEIDGITHTVRMGISDHCVAVDRQVLNPQYQSQIDADRFYQCQIENRPLEIGALLLENNSKQIAQIRFTAGKIDSLQDCRFYYHEYPKMIFVS